MDDAAVAPARRKLTVDDYYRMAEAGILRWDDRIELLDGQLVEMAPMGQGHAAISTGINRTLILACGDRALVAPHIGLRFDRWNELQPDFAVLKPRADLYATGERPTAQDVLLLVEVSDSFLSYDQKVKLPLYARSGIAEYWIVDLLRRVLDRHYRPEGDAYAETTTHRAGETVALDLAPEIVVTLALVFP